MPKKQRISRVDFETMDASRARRIHGILFTLSIAQKSPHSQGDEAKFACVVSKKISNKAVDRNRIRRMAKEVCRIAGGDISGAKMLVFYAKKEAKSADFKTIDADIRKLLSQV